METELLESALLYGMTVEQYWHDNPQLYFRYRNAFIQKQKMISHNIWQQGAVIKSALMSSPLVVIGMTDTKKYKVPKYIEEPKFDDNSENLDKDGNKILTEKEKEFERLKARIFFDNLN